MEMAVGRTASPAFGLTRLSQVPSSPFSNHRSRNFLSPRNSLSRGVASMSVKARFGSSKGGAGVLERPIFDQSQTDSTPQLEEGGVIRRLRDQIGVGSGDSYRVLLVDDQRHTEKLVAKALPQVVPSVTPDDARRLFQESRDYGVAIVIVTVKEHAEFYSQMMVRQGLRSTIEPDSNNM